MISLSARIAACLIGFAIQISVAHGQILSGQFTISLDRQFDYASGQYVALTIPSNQTVSFSLPLLGTATNGSNNVSFSFFGGPGQFISTSVPIPKGELIPSSTQANYGFFAYNSDFSGSFTEQYALQSYRSYFHGDGHYTTQSIFLSLIRRSASPDNTSSSNYFATPQQYADALAEFASDPTKFQRDIALYGSDVYQRSTGNIEMGTRWEGQVTGLSLTTSPAVPEPTSWALLILGFGIVGTSLRIRQAGRQSLAA